MPKQNNRQGYILFKKHAKHVALILLVAVFSTTFLLPISEARAQPVDKIRKGGEALGKAGEALFKGGGVGQKGAKGAGSAAKTTGKAGKGSAMNTALSMAGAFLGVAGIIAFVVIVLGITQNFVKAAIRMDAKYYDLNNSFINRGWKMMRDLCNLFFLLVLLFIAFCTILQIEKYNAKKNLLTLILMALLINFSKPIAIFIFDGSQLMMQWFLRDGGDIFNKLGTVSHIGDLLTDFIKGGAGGQDLIAGFLVGIVFTFIYIVVLFCLGLFLFIRLVAIWLLVIVSPVAFFAMILPDFRKISSQWWDNLFRYSYVGPAIAFFLWLSSSMADQIGHLKLNYQSVTGEKGSAFLNDAFFIPYIITIVFLFAALMMANQFGIHFAQAITKSANRFMAWVPLTGMKWVDREYLAKGIPLGGGRRLPLSIPMWIAGWSKKTKEREEEVYGDAQADVADILGKFFRAGRKPPDFHRRRRDAEQVAKYRKEQELMGTSAEINLEGLQALETADMDPKEKKRRALAYLQTLFSQRDFNEAIKQRLGLHKPIDAKYAPSDIRTILGKFGIAGDEATYYARRYGEMAFAAGDYHLYNLEEENPDTRLGNLAGKYNTVDNQQFQIKIHPEALWKINDLGEVEDLAGTADITIDHLLENGADYLPRNRGGFSAKTLSRQGIDLLLKKYARTNDRRYMDFIKLVVENHSKTQDNVARAKAAVLARIAHINATTGSTITSPFGRPTP